MASFYLLNLPQPRVTWKESLNELSRSGWLVGMTMWDPYGKFQPTGSETIPWAWCPRWSPLCTMVLLSLALLEGACHWRYIFKKVSKAHARLNVCLSVPSAWESDVSSQLLLQRCDCLLP